MNTLDFGMGFGMTIFWIVVAVIFLLAKQGIYGSSGQSETVSASPLEILKKRYARGEIDKDEYESMKKELDKE